MQHEVNMLPSGEDEILHEQKMKMKASNFKMWRKVAKTFLSSHLSYTASLHWLHFDLTPGSQLVYFKSVRDDIRQDECDDTIDKKKKQTASANLDEQTAKTRQPDNIAELN